MELKEKSAARLLKHFANSSIDTALQYQHTSFTPTAFLFYAYHSPITQRYWRAVARTPTRAYTYTVQYTAIACWRRGAAGRLEPSHCACVIGICVDQSNRARGPLWHEFNKKVWTIAFLPLAVLVANGPTHRPTHIRKLIEGEIIEGEISVMFSPFYCTKHYHLASFDPCWKTLFWTSPIGLVCAQKDCSGRLPSFFCCKSSWGFPFLIFDKDVSTSGICFWCSIFAIRKDSIKLLTVIYYNYYICRTRGITHNEEFIEITDKKLVK